MNAGILAHFFWILDQLAHLSQKPEHLPPISLVIQAGAMVGQLQKFPAKQRQASRTGLNGIETMADSARASNAGLERVDRARQHKGWKKGATAWWQLAATSPATLKRCWRRRALQTDAFIAITQTVIPIQNSRFNVSVKSRKLSLVEGLKESP